MVEFTRSRKKLLLAFVVCAPFLLFLPALVTGKVLFWGTPVMQFVPWNFLAFEELRLGILPLWNPYNGMGAPLLANYQLALFYPPNWINYLLAAIGGIRWMVWGQTMIMGLHLSWAAAGMIVLVRKLRVGITGQLVSGLAFGMCGYLVARVGFFSIVVASCWLPWIFLAVENLTEQVISEEKKRNKILKAGILLTIYAAMQLFSGHAQISLYTVMLVSAWAFVRGATAKSWKGIFRLLLSITGFYLLAVLIASVQLIPTMEYLVESQRSASVDYSVAMVYSFWPWRFLTLLFPDFFGNPGLGNYWGYANFWEDAVYIGILPLIAAAGTLFQKLGPHKTENHHHRPIIIFSWVITGLGFLLGLGWNTPVFPFLYEHVPTFNMFNGPARFLIWAEFGLAVLAGIGIDRWTRPQGLALKSTRLAVAGSLAVAVGAGLSIFFLKGVNLTFIPAAVLAGGLGACAALLALWIPTDQGDTPDFRWTAAVVILIAIDLFQADWKLNPFIDADFYGNASKNYELDLMKDESRIFISADDEYRMKFDRFFTFNSFENPENWESIWKSNLPDTNILTHTQMFNNFDPMVPERYARMRDYLAKTNLDIQSNLLEALSVTGVQSVPGEDVHSIESTPIEGVPRYRLYGCAVYAKDSDHAWNLLKERMESGEANYFSPPIIESGGNDGLNCSGNLVGEIKTIDHTPDRFSFEVQANKDSWLEIAEVFYPGWKAFIDGKEKEIYPSNSIFKAVRIPVGLHTVEIVYRPDSFLFGLLASGAGLILLGIALYLSRRATEARQ